MILLEQMTVFFLIMLLGYGLAKKNIMNEQSGKTLSWLVVNVGNPALMISGAITDEPLENSKVLKVFLLAAVIYGILLLCGWLLPRILKVKEKETYSLLTVFGNIGFLGIPLISAMYGQDAIIYASFFTLIFNFLIYTYGIAVIQGEKLTFQNLHKMVNVGCIACVIEIFIYFFRIPMPGVVESLVSKLGSLTGPLSMLVVGISMASIPLKELLLDKKMLLFAGIRLILLPVIMMLGMKQWISDPTLLGVCFVMVGTPAATMTAMMAQQYSDDYKLAAKGVALTTLLSVVTMPVLFAVLLR